MDDDNGDWSVTQKKTLTKGQKTVRRCNAEASSLALETYQAAQREERESLLKPKSKAKEDEKVLPVVTTASVEEDPSAIKVTRVSFQQRQRLITLRNLKGLTREQMAHGAQVHVNLATNYENGRAVFDSKIYNKLLTYLTRQPDRSMEKED